MIGRRPALGALLTLPALGWLGCGGRPALTRATRLAERLEGPLLGQVQVYTSDEIVLVRGAATNAEHGKVRRVLEEIRLPAGTPGRVLYGAEHHLLVGFDPSRPGAALWFSIKDLGSARQRPEAARFELSHLENEPPRDEKQPFTPRWSAGLLVRWDGRAFRVAEERMFTVHLMYEPDLERIRRTPPGWKLR